MQATQRGCTAGLRRTVQRRLWAGVVLAGALLGGCGMGGPVAEGSAALLSGMPKCDPSLLHPHLEVGAAAGLPGKLIVYVDGVMACVDDASHVDQLMTQIEGHGVGASLTLPTAAAGTSLSVAATVTASGSGSSSR